jgi:alginate O-acetyltransferase complex protein AlgI
MLFNSWAFVILFLLVFPLYHWGFSRLPNARAAQIALLITASLVFYGYYLPWLLVLFVISLLVNGFAAQTLFLDNVPKGRRRLILMVAVCFNIGGLAYFKYASLIAQTILPQSIYDSLAPSLKQIPLPVGISFYTFEGLSLICDLYFRKTRGLEELHADAHTSTLRFQSKIWMFISFFPHLVAGPVLRAQQFITQIGKKSIRDVDWDDVVRKLVVGYFLKMVIADNLKEATVALTYPYFLKLSKLELIGLLYGYSFQIFADFAGYSLIAMGLAEAFGYKLIYNFNFPYISQSLTEFWQRWHISLSTFLRDYLYIPLGGSRKGAVRTYINLFIVMFLGGLWHGAAWGYAIWGTAHGIGLAVERFWKANFGKAERTNHPLLTALRVFVTFNIVSMLWLLFKLPHFADTAAYLHALRNNVTWGVEPRDGFILALFSPPIIFYHFWNGWFRSSLGPQSSQPRPYRLAENAALGLMAFLIMVNSGTAGTFIYFQF